MQVGLMATPHQTWKQVTPLLLFGFKTQQHNPKKVPQNEK